MEKTKAAISLANVGRFKAIAFICTAAAVYDRREAEWVDLPEAGVREILDLE